MNYVLLTPIVLCTLKALSMLHTTKNELSYSKNVTYTDTLNELYKLAEAKYNQFVYGPERDCNLQYIYFYHNYKPYKFPLLIKHGPKTDISKIMWNENDVTNEVLQYMGPNRDFFKLEVTPKMLNYTSLTFHLDDKVITFNENEIIKL